MGCFRQSRAEEERSECTLARVLAPEDIRRGDYVAPLYVISEWPSWLWDHAGIYPRDELVRIRSMPHEEPKVMKVRAVCLPFVLARLRHGEQQTIDVRKYRLARLDKRFGQAAWRGARQ